ncbi:hypothetical protein SGPA1_10052 [Streptomyces misionensis JCM 4497]
MVRSAGGRGGRGVRCVLPPLGCAADRRRHRAAAPADRHEPGHGHDPDRPRGAGPRGVRDGARQPCGAGRHRPRRGGGAGHRNRPLPAVVSARRPRLGPRPGGPARGGGPARRTAVRGGGAGRGRGRRRPVRGGGGAARFVRLSTPPAPPAGHSSASPA